MAVGANCHMIMRKELFVLLCETPDPGPTVKNKRSALKERRRLFCISSK